MGERRLAARIVSGIAIASLCFAQDPETTIKVDVDIVSVLCSVRDKNGAFQTKLNKEDFTVFEDGKQQEVRYFARETDLPLTIGLLVDTSKSQENLIEIEKRAAMQFFKTVLRQQKDMAFLMQFGHEAELLQDYTNSPRLLQEGLNELRLSVPVGGLHPGPVPQSGPTRGTILYDAVYLAATEKLNREVGRKVIVVITDGMDYGSRVKLQEAIASAHRSDAIIYGIYYADRYYGGSDGDLKRMAEDTGGRVFHVDRKNTLELVFQQIQEEMRSQYAIGYTPTNPAKDGAFRKIEIRPADKKLKVQARKGYFAATQ
jgi:VWFA-related protein